MADTKTARPSLRVFAPSSTAVPALNASGLFASGDYSTEGTSEFGTLTFHEGDFYTSD